MSELQTQSSGVWEAYNISSSSVEHSATVGSENRVDFVVCGRLLLCFSSHKIIFPKNQEKSNDFAKFRLYISGIQNEQ